MKFNDPINPDFSTLTNGRFDWIALINNSANWDTYGTVKPSNVDFVESKCLQGACKLIRKNLENETPK